MKISLRRRHVIKKTMLGKFKEILNLEVHPNHITGSRVTAVLLNGLILLIGGVASERVCACSLRSRLVLGQSGEASRLVGLLSKGPSPSSFCVFCVSNESLSPSIRKLCLVGMLML